MFCRKARLLNGGGSLFSFRLAGLVRLVASWGERGWDRISYVLPQVSFGKNKELMRDYPARIIRINSFLSRKNGSGATRSSIFQGFGRGFSLKYVSIFSGLDVSYSQCIV